MKTIALAKLAVAVAAGVSSLAQAVPLVYTFTGTTLDLNALTVTGSLTIDADLFANVTTIAANKTGNTPVSSRASIAFSDGSSFTLDPGLTGNSYEIVSRTTGANTFNVGTTLSTFATSATLQINTYDMLSAFASTIFQTPVADVSFGQPVTFNTAGSFNTGSFSFANNLAYTYAQAFSVNAVTVAPVPEPEAYALLLAGLAAVAFVARRRKQA